MLAHVVAQAPPLVRFHAAPATIVVAKALLLPPVVAHLLANLAAILRRQIAPPVTRQCSRRRAEQDSKQERQDKAGFHGGAGAG